MADKLSGVFTVTLLVGCCLLTLVGGFHCKKQYYVCGDERCCCHDTTADCHRRRLTYIPELPNNTVKVEFNENRLGNITRETFRNLTKLQLRQLFIKDNIISNIAPDAFTGLNNLTLLDMSENVSINKTALKLAFTSIQTTADLTLNLNKIKISNQMTEDFFEGLANISVVKLLLTKNLLKSYNERAFDKLGNLQYLYLTKNRITDVTGYSKVGLPRLKSLYLDDNGFAMYPPHLCRLNETVTAYPRLNTLDLSVNLIHIIPYGRWWCFPKLKKLALNGNVVQVIRENVFTPLTALEVLNLSAMKGGIKIMEPNALNITSLVELNLNDNGLKFTPGRYDTFRACPNLRKLHLSHNNFLMLKTRPEEFTKLLSPLVKLEYFEGVDIHMCAFPTGLLQRLPKLNTLNFDGNGIYTWNRTTFENVTELRSLNLQGNNIHTLTAEQFPANMLASLRQLNLAHNPFACTCDLLWFRNWINATVTAGNISLTLWPRLYQCATPPAWHWKALNEYRPTAESCRNHNKMIIVYVTIGSFLLLFTVVASIVYRQRWYLRYWLYMLRRRRRSTNPDSLLINDGDGEERPRYDAYVIYEDDDVQFVRDHLCRLVEEKHRKRLCVRDRDSAAGGSRIGVFADDIYASGNIVAVISRNFVSDPWCQFQLDVALSRQMELGRSCILLAVLDNIDLKSLNKTWCVILTKMPTADWCTDGTDIRSTVFEQKLLKLLVDD